MDGKAVQHAEFLKMVHNAQVTETYIKVHTVDQRIFILPHTTVTRHLPPFLEPDPRVNLTSEIDAEVGMMEATTPPYFNLEDIIKILDEQQAQQSEQTSNTSDNMPQSSDGSANNTEENAGK